MNYISLGEPLAAVTNLDWVMAQTQWTFVSSSCPPELLPPPGPVAFDTTRGLYQTKNGKLLKGSLRRLWARTLQWPHHRTWPFMAGNAVLWLHLPGGEAGK